MRKAKAKKQEGFQSAKELIESIDDLFPVPDDDTVAELGKVIDYNDGNPDRRVSTRRTIEWLARRGFVCSRTRLDTLCVKLLGRKSFLNA